MKKDNTDKINRLNKSLEIDYPKSKDEIWSLMEDKLSVNVSHKRKIIKLSVQQWALAASVVILLGTGFFMRFYEVSYSTVAGEQYTAQLPDGSTAELNGQSSIQFNPYWWKLNRNVKFEGEGYFEVEKGSRFSVESKNGTTSVLGTSFNIYSRDANYEVSCLTGKVQVEVLDGLTKIIYPNQQAKLNNNQLLISESNASHSIAWKSNSFYFTSSPVNRVFREIEVAYNVTINIQVDETLLYSGSFKKSDNIEDVLKIVCVPLNLKFAKQQTGGYIIKNIDF